VGKRVTEIKFFVKNGRVALLRGGKQGSIKDSGDNIVKSVRSGGDAESSNRKEDGEIDSGERSKYEL